MSERYDIAAGRGMYLYVLEGGPVTVNGVHIPALGAAMITEEQTIEIISENDAELLLVDVKR